MGNKMLFAIASVIAIVAMLFTLVMMITTKSTRAAGITVSITIPMLIVAFVLVIIDITLS